MRGIIMGKQSMELILAGRKTQTRRVRSTNPYRVGEKLYVKEPIIKRNGEWCYRDGHPARLGGRSISHPVPAIFLPEEWARLFLIVRAHRVEQLHEITADDALREGVDPTSANPVGSYRDWWEALHGRGAWDVNPFVDVYDFEHFTMEGARMTCRVNRRIVPPRVPIEHDGQGKPLDEETYDAMAAVVITLSCIAMLVLIGLPLVVVWWLIGW